MRVIRPVPGCCRSRPTGEISYFQQFMNNATTSWRERPRIGAPASWANQPPPAGRPGATGAWPHGDRPAPTSAVRAGRRQVSPDSGHRMRVSTDRHHGLLSGTRRVFGCWNLVTRPGPENRPGVIPRQCVDNGHCCCHFGVQPAGHPTGAGTIAGATGGVVARGTDGDRILSPEDQMKVQVVFRPCQNWRAMAGW